MKYTLGLSVFLSLCAFFSLSEAQLMKGTTLNITISAPSISGNKLGDPAVQPISVYLPPSYTTLSKKYPVVYFLPGYSDHVADWASTGTYQGFKIQDAMDQLLSVDSVKEMIVVIVNGYNALGGSFYVNSPVTGNWEDFVVKDVVQYVDANYRTLQNRDSRAIGGHSMGGFGALNIAMRHPDIFCSVFALSPGLFAENGLQSCQIFKSETFIRQFIAKEQDLNTLSADSALSAFKKYIQSRFNANDWDTPFSYAYATAFSPDSDKNAPFIDYPYSVSGDSLAVDSAKWKNYDNGFGNLREKVKTYKNNLLSLKRIDVDEGTHDYYAWIMSGCVYFAQLLTAENIPNIITRFNGDHQDQVGNRFKLYLLPTCSKILRYDTTATKVKSHGGNAPSQYDLYNFPNPFNPTTSICYQLPVQGFISMKAFDMLGREVATLVDGMIDAGHYSATFDASKLSSGVYFVHMTALPQDGSQLYTKAMKILMMK